jgi:acetyl-CoA acetyltransferase
MSLKDRTAIAGIGQTRFGKGFEESEEELGAQAIKLALDDAGIDPSEVDGLCSFTFQATEEEEIVRDLGLSDLAFYARTPAGGGGGCGTVGHAAMAVATGQAEVVVAWRARKRSGRASRVWAQTEERVGGRHQWLRPWGLIRPVDEIAMLAKRYMHLYGATRDHLANIALACRYHANRNPNAVMHDKKMTREDYMAARWISDPLCLFDCCLETDGALALVIVSAERAKDLRQKPAYIHAFGMGITEGSSMLSNYFCDDPLHTQSWACAKQLFKTSDLKPKDIKVAQIYDAFTPEIWLTLEGYGFCGVGEGAAFTENGALQLGGRLPINTAGGGLSEAYVHGFNMMLEGVRQIRGISTSQVAAAECCFVSSSDANPTSALLLRG